MRKPLKVGVRTGEGPPPGYLWTVVIVDHAHEEMVKEFTELECEHLRDQVRTLAAEKNLRVSVILDVDAIEDFFELRDKGGVLGKKNVRVYFDVWDDQRLILILGVVKKESEGASNPIKIRMRRRLRMLKAGEYGSPVRAAAK